MPPKHHLKRLLLWLIAIMLVIGISGLFLINYAFSKFMDNLVAGIEQQVKAELEAQLLTQSLTESVTVTQPTDSGHTEKSMTHINSLPSPNFPSTDSSTVDSSTNSASHPSTSPTSQMVSPMSSRITESSTSDDSIAYSPEISLSKAEAIKDRVTISEKATISKILISKLGMSDIKLIQEMASGGLSVEEKREVRKVLINKLSPEEYDQLIEIAKKYGLSEGKKYSEVIQFHQDSNEQIK